MNEEIPKGGQRDAAPGYGLSSGLQSMAIRAKSIVLLTAGVGVGMAGLALGAFLASGDNGWTSSLIYSVVGLVAAPMAALSWSSRRSVRCQVLAAAAILLGVAATMGLMLEFTHEMSPITHAWSQAPLAVALWAVLWISWGACAVARLVYFQQPRTRGRLSSRRGDAGR
ncbi:MAG: hypothetical protein EHM59_09905 [Betaproteobacteria bacterium]|nr:MAG: hypothetical protein EHM59_09905 [Betaproteobacteria bacterium]